MAPMKGDPQPVTREQHLLEAAELAVKILDRNLGHQTEKCYDALAILRRAVALYAQS